MDLHQQSVRPGGHRRQRQRLHQLGPSRRMAGIYDHRQMRQPFQRRDRRHVQRRPPAGQPRAIPPESTRRPFASRFFDILSDYNAVYNYIIQIKSCQVIMRKN